MAVWTKTVTPLTIEYDNGAGSRYIVHRTPEHFHAEQIVPWTAPEAAGRLTPEAVAQSFEDYLRGTNNSVIGS